MDDHSQNNELLSDLLGRVVRLPSIRVSRSFNSLSARTSPTSARGTQPSPSKASPVNRKRVDACFHSAPAYWLSQFQVRAILPWLVLFFGLWSYVGIQLRPRWTYIEEADADAAWYDLNPVKDVVGVMKDIVENEDLQIRVYPLKASLLAENQGTVRGDDYSIVPPKKRSHDAFERKTENWHFPFIGFVNHSVGRLVGPFKDAEEKIFGLIRWSHSCDSTGHFATFVRGKAFLLVVHELSMTGAPLAMLELASEINKCGGKVWMVALSRRGGLLEDLGARGITLLPDKGLASFQVATKADMVVAGSAVCASWIQRYLAFSKWRSKPIAWWIMENRHEYFDQSKHMLGKANVLIFLSEAQLQQWRGWSEMEGISLPSKIELIPLSVNEELSMKAGLEEEDSEAVEDRQRVLRDSVRKEMGLTPSDVLIASLSTISRAKGQLLLLRAVLLALKNGDGDRKCLDVQHLKIIIGSVGSRSNKVIYIQELLNLISSSPQLSNATFWTPATVNVAPLYLAADAYVMNSQGIGETFGRVTIEAMAFGLPVLGTDAGGTKEVIEDNVTGLLHPIGKEGVSMLARQIRYILCNSRAREQMGLKGRERVKNFYMKRTMYEKLARALWV